MKDLIYRVWLRLVYGRARWHDRKFPPGFRFDREEEGLARCRWAGVDLTVKVAGAIEPKAAPRANLLLSGPSVGQIREPQLLNNYPLMCVNGSPVLLNGKSFEHYHIVDRRFTQVFRENFQKYALSCGHLWIGMELLKLLMEVSDPAFLKRVNFCVYTDYRRPFRQRARDPMVEEDCVCADELVCFSKNLNKGVFVSPTVAFSALQLLYNFGFERVHVYGLDLGNTGRFYASSAGQSLERHRQRIFTEMELSSRVYRDNGRTLLNCSPQTELPEALMERGDPNQL